MEGMRPIRSILGAGAAVAALMTGVQRPSQHSHVRRLGRRHPNVRLPAPPAPKDYIWRGPEIAHPEKFMHSAARKRAGLPEYVAKPSKRTRDRNAAFRKKRQEAEQSSIRAEETYGLQPRSVA
jgi:hypothetical protein